MTNRDRYKSRVRAKPGEQKYATKSGSTTLAAMSLGEVAKALGCSRQAVQQLERSALHKIRMGLLPVIKEINPELYEVLCK